MSAVAVRKAALAAKLAAETAANPVTPVSSGQVSAHQTLDEDAVDSQQDGGSNSSRITEARNKKVSSRGSALTKKLRRASKPSGNKTLERRYYQEDIKEVSDSENDMELATEALDAASGSDQDFHFELGDSLYPGSGATTPSGRPKKKRRVSTDEQASYSNFQPTLGINICQISKEALARYPNLAQKGTAVCVSLHPDEVSPSSLPPCLEIQSLTSRFNLSFVVLYLLRIGLDYASCEPALCFFHDSHARLATGRSCSSPVVCASHESPSHPSTCLQKH